MQYSVSVKTFDIGKSNCLIIFTRSKMYNELGMLRNWKKYCDIVLHCIEIRHFHYIFKEI